MMAAMARGGADERCPTQPATLHRGHVMDDFKRHIIGFRGRNTGRHGACPCCRETSVGDSRQLARTRLQRDLREILQDPCLNVVHDPFRIVIHSPFLPHDSCEVNP